MFDLYRSRSFLDIDSVHTFTHKSEISCGAAIEMGNESLDAKSSTHAQHGRHPQNSSQPVGRLS